MNDLWDWIMGALGFGVSEVLTPEQKVAKLKSDAEAAEEHATLVKQAVEYRRRIAIAKQAGGPAGGRRNLAVFAVVLVVFFIVIKFAGC